MTRAAEGGESVTVSGAVGGDDLAVVGAVLRIADDERASSRVGLSLSPGAAAEAGGSTDVVLTATLDGTARATATAVWVRVGWLPPRVSLGTPGLATVHLVDDDARGVTVSAESLSIPEGESRGYTVVLDSKPEGDVIVTPEVPPAAEDLSVSPAKLTFTPQNWNTAQTLTVAAAEDDDAVRDAPALLAHSARGGGYDAVSIAAVEATIVEKDTPLLDVLAAASVAEDAGTIDIVLNLDRETASAIVAYETADGTAKTPDDYGAAGGVAVFHTGVTSITVTVPIVDDDMDEAESESFYLVLSAPEDLSFAGGATSLTVERTILDDDLPAVHAFFSQSVYTAAEGASVQVTVSVDADPERRIVIPLTHAPATGASSADYGGVPANVVLTSGVSTASFDLTVADDAMDDDGESVALGFGTLPERVAHGPTDAATVHLVDDDTRGVTVTPTNLLITEGETGAYGIVLASRPTAAVTIAVTAPSGAALSILPAALTFTPGAWTTALSFQVTASDDADAIGAAPVELTHSATGGDYAGTSVAAVRVTVIEDDVPVVDVTPTVSVAEAAGSAAFVVTLDLASDKDVTVVYATVDGSAVSPGDYAGVQDTLVVAAGDTSGTVTVAIVDDADDEAEAETFQLRLSAPANAQLKGATDALTATATIRDDDDPAVTVAFESALVVANEGGAGTVAVTIDVDPERDIVIPVAAVPGDGAAPSDYSGVPPSLTFTAGGARRQTFSVAATDDDVDDDGETVRLSFGDLPDRVEAGDPKTATVHLGDNDQKAARTQTQGGAGRHVTVVEGGAASYRLSLSSEPTSDVVVAVAGAAGTDLSTPASLTFTPGNWNVDQTVTVTAAEDDDALDDAPVTLTHTATGGGYADVEFPEVIVTIVENDHPVVDVTRAVTVAGGCRNGGFRGDAGSGEQQRRDRGLRDDGRLGPGTRRLHGHERHADRAGRRPGGDDRRADRRRQRGRGRSGNLHPGAAQPLGGEPRGRRERAHRDRDGDRQRRPRRHAAVRERRPYGGGGRRGGGGSPSRRRAGAAVGGAAHGRVGGRRDGGRLFRRAASAHLRRRRDAARVHAGGGAGRGRRRRRAGVDPVRPGRRHGDRGSGLHGGRRLRADDRPGRDRGDGDVHVRAAGRRGIGGRRGRAGDRLGRRTRSRRHAPRPARRRCGVRGGAAVGVAGRGVGDRGVDAGHGDRGAGRYRTCRRDRGDGVGGRDGGIRPRPGPTTRRWRTSR